LLAPLARTARAALDNAGHLFRVLRRIKAQWRSRRQKNNETETP
jgi:hypothetical protein